MLGGAVDVCVICISHTLGGNVGAMKISVQPPCSMAAQHGKVIRDAISNGVSALRVEEALATSGRIFKGVLIYGCCSWSPIC